MKKGNAVGVLLALSLLATAAFAAQPSPRHEGTRVPPTIGEEPLIKDAAIDVLDQRDQHGMRYDDFRVMLEAGQRLRISANSTRIDPMIQVYEPGSTEPVAMDDDSGQGFNARLIFEPRVTGVHRIRVVGVFPELTGSFRLRVERALPFPDPVTTQLTAEPIGWSRVIGSLSLEDSVLDGRLFDDYLVPLRENEEILVRLDSGTFDPVVQVLRAEDREGDALRSDDDSDVGNGSLLWFRAERAGNYILRVTSFAPRATGEYRLRIARASD